MKWQKMRGGSNKWLCEICGERITCPVTTHAKSHAALLELLAEAELQRVPPAPLRPPTVLQQQEQPQPATHRQDLVVAGWARVKVALSRLAVASSACVSGTVAATMGGGRRHDRQQNSAAS